MPFVKIKIIQKHRKEKGESPFFTQLILVPEIPLGVPYSSRANVQNAIHTNGFQWQCAHMTKMADYRNRSAGNQRFSCFRQDSAAFEHDHSICNMAPARLLGAIPSLLYFLGGLLESPSSPGSRSSGLCSPFSVDGAQSTLLFSEAHTCCGNSSLVPITSI